MTGNGFTLRNSPEKEEDKQHQYGHPEDMGDIPLVFSILQSPLLRLPSILPFHLQLDYPNSIEFLDSQEAVIFERYSVTVQTVQPELTPGWKYRDVELLQLAQDDFEKWNTNAT
ncbi:hypothetical protein FRC17_005594 [Serendipita sp. 399]|nr:hypothetical protein FRC17_005594 [Serendipita sp. 399]